MKSLIAGEWETQNLPAYSTLAVIVASEGAAFVTRLGDKVGDPPLGRARVAADARKVIGPFATDTRHQISCDSGSLTYEIAPADFPATTSDVERIERLSQADYDALLPPDAATLYLIT